METIHYESIASPIFDHLKEKGWEFSYEHHSHGVVHLVLRNEKKRIEIVYEPMSCVWCKANSDNKTQIRIDPDTYTPPFGQAHLASEFDKVRNMLEDTRTKLENMNWIEQGGEGNA